MQEAGTQSEAQVQPGQPHDFTVRPHLKTRTHTRTHSVCGHGGRRPIILHFYCKPSAPKICKNSKIFNLPFTLPPIVLLLKSVHIDTHTKSASAEVMG